LSAMAKPRKGQRRVWPRRIRATDRPRLARSSKPRIRLKSLRSRPRDRARARQFEAMESYLASCFESESPPRVSGLAKLLEVSRSNLLVTFCIATGLTPSEHIKARQIAAARLLLSKTELTVTQVGYAVGFGTRRTFFREFQKRTKMTPIEYRLTQHNVPILPVR
jgi:AraC-like DNA-binding protein